MSREQQEDLPWFVVARVALLIVCLLATSLSILFPKSPVLAGLGSLYLPLAFLFAFTALSAYWLRLNPERHLFIALSLAVDIIFVSAIVYATGGPMSPLQFLFLPIAVLAGVMLPAYGALSLSVAAGLTYTSLGVLLVTGIIPPAHPLQTVYAISAERLAIQSLGLWSTLILMSVMSMTLGKRIKVERERAISNEHILLELGSKQKALVQGLSEAVILFNKDGVIESLSPSCETLFSVTESESRGQHLLHWLEEHGVKIAKFDYHSETFTEFESDFNTEQGRIHLKGSWQGVGSDKHGFGVVIFQDVTKLRSMEDQLAMQEKMARLLARDNSQLEKNSPLANFIGETKVMRKIFSLIERVANSEATVLITGESGTGKELVARAIHQSSERNERSFIAVNCGAIPEGLIESELFGHKKGAFTGAISDHIGLVRKAQGGTLFLDEVGELPLSTQAKLLRALQEKRIRAVGSDEEITIDTRIIAATNRDLKTEIQEGRFREDLFYRLNVVGIRLPALRERREDIPLLVHALLSKICQSSNDKPVISSSAMQLLLQYSYPGNVRELENILERATVLGGEVILPEHLSECLEEGHGRIESYSAKKETQIIVDEQIEFPVKLDELLATIERSYIEQALNASSGVKKRAAGLLGMNFRSFRYRLQKYDIAPD